jgi:hypothetical protein
MPENFPPDWEIGPARPVAEIEAENVYEDDGRVPPMPFGSKQNRWLVFKAQARPGDTFHNFTSSPASWEHLAGRAGYVLVRDSQMVDTFITVMN